MNTSSGGSPWRKSSHSSGVQSQCVEVAAHRGKTLVRDTADRQGPALAIGAASWTRFLAAIRQQ